MEFLCAFLGEFRPVHLKLYIYIRGTNDYNFNFDGNKMEFFNYINSMLPFILILPLFVVSLLCWFPPPDLI